MNILELANTFVYRPDSSVPDWMLGYFRRHAITFCTGESDTDTHVSWMQSRNFTIDLRLPKSNARAPSKPLSLYSREELEILADYEGWQADSEWNGRALSWHSATSLQLHNRWPEPAVLHRVGNCMIEFAPSGAYVEDWRLQSSASGPLIGLKLIEEYDPLTHERYHSGGGLILCGEFAGLVLGRPGEVSLPSSPNGLRNLVIEMAGSPHQLAQLFQFETSIAKGSIERGYQILYSTNPSRIGESLCALEGFSLEADKKTVTHRFDVQGKPRVRTFTIDTLESEFDFITRTSCTETAQVWLQQEAKTLGRYSRRLE